MATSLGVAMVCVVPQYQSTNTHITPGQISPVVRSEVQNPAAAWVFRMFELCKQGQEDAALKEIASAVVDFKSSDKVGQLADDLAYLKLKLNELPDIVLIGLLRTTYSIRSLIPSWGTLLEHTERVLASHDKNPRVLLRGLKKFL